MMKRNKDIKTPYHYKNLFFWYIGINYILMPFLAYYVGGSYMHLFYFLLIGIVSDLYLETINYIEHYGL